MSIDSPQSLPAALSDDAIEALADAWLDGIATPAEEIQLAELIARSPAVARLFVARAQLNQEVGTVVLQLTAENAWPLPSAVDGPRSFPCHRWPWRNMMGPRRFARRLCAAAAAVVVLTSAGLIGVAGRRRVQSRPVVEAADFTLWDGAGPAIGQSLAVDVPWTLVKGKVWLRWPSGASAVISAPASFKAEEASFFCSNPGALRLSQGVAHVHCPEHAHGFTLFTPDGTFEDLGTDFQVAHAPGHPTSLTVYEGRVQASSVHPESKPQEVRAGQTLIVNGQSPVSELHVGVVLAGPGTPWLYWDGHSAAPEDWMRTDYPDTLWPRTAGGGFSGGTVVFPSDHSTDFSSGFRSDARLYRLHFQSSDPTRLRALRLIARFGDGVVFYLNGQELARSNMPPDAAFSQATLAQSAGVREQVWVLPANGLVVGENVLAVSVHSADPTQSRVPLFDPGLIEAIPID